MHCHQKKDVAAVRRKGKENISLRYETCDLSVKCGVFHTVSIRGKKVSSRSRVGKRSVRKRIYSLVSNASNIAGTPQALRADKIAAD